MGQRQASAQGLQLLRDSEAETVLRDMAAPIFVVAGIGPNAVRISIVDDATLNAFVTQGLNMFFHSGLLLEAGDAEEVVGVMAHEIGHIAGGHLIRLRGSVRNASRLAILTQILGIAAAVGTGRGDVGAAVITGGQQLATRSILSFSRAQESSADAAALTFLNQAGMTAHGFLRFMETLGEQDLLPANRQVQYARTHPLTRDRVSAIRAAVEQDGRAEIGVSGEVQERFRRVQGKLLGYVQPRVAFQRHPANDPTIAGQYARSIALWRTGDIVGALSTIEALIEQEPENPYFHEQHGQILFESGRIDEAVAAYRVAAEALPSAPLIQTAYAHSLIESRTEANLMLAVDRLQLSLRQEGNSPFAHRLMAIAYGRLGQDGPARLHLAEEAMLRREIPTAKGHLERAKQTIPADDEQNLIRARDLENAITALEAENDE
ncbi:MAG: M48 family metalloprotease [Alphaproteobacteria bacterium]|nr:M48 family metalloprotease [Alphaproteobacteria bacterium SS10]